jgi:UDP-glucose 4-epimerase
MDNDINNNRILVTGGAGFIGSHLVDELLKRNFNVRVIDNLINGSLENLSEAHKLPNFQFLQGDILDNEIRETAIKNVDYVFHLACLGVRQSLKDPFQNHRVNAEGTLKMLEDSRKHGIKHFFYISSSEIYGKTNMFPITEDALPNPLTVYGASKFTGEKYALAYQESFGLRTSVFRFFNNYGPRAHYEGDAGEIIPRTIAYLLYDKQPVIFGDGTITRDFFFVKDTANALIELFNIRDRIVGETINIGTGVEVPLKELIEKILGIMGMSSTGIRYHQGRPADVPRLWVNSGKFKTLTGFNPGYSLDEGLRITIEFYRNLMNTKDLLAGIVDENWK